jgi:hypothetical protein
LELNHLKNRSAEAADLFLFLEVDLPEKQSTPLVFLKGKRKQDSGLVLQN